MSASAQRERKLPFHSDTVHYPVKWMGNTSLDMCRSIGNKRLKGQLKKPLKGPKTAPSPQLWVIEKKGKPEKIHVDIQIDTY